MSYNINEIATQTDVTGLQSAGVSSVGTNVYFTETSHTNIYKVNGSGIVSVETSTGGVTVPGSLGLHDNTLYVFSKDTSNKIGIYPIGGSLSTVSEAINGSTVTISPVGNVAMTSSTVAYTASNVTVSMVTTSNVYQVSNIVNGQDYSIMPAIVYTALTTRVLGGISTDGTYFYVSSYDTSTGVGYVTTFHVEDVTNGIGSGGVVAASGTTIITITPTATKLINSIDCFYYNSKIYVIYNDNTSDGFNLYSYELNGDNPTLIVASDNTRIPVTFNVTSGSNGLKFYISDSTTTVAPYGNKITKVYDASSGSSVGGDPHITPLLNNGTTYLMPNTNGVYNYFDNLDETERVVINSKQWMIDYDWIANVTTLDQDKCISEHIKYDDIRQIDSAFNKYICIMYSKAESTEKIIIDMETLENVIYDENKINNYSLDKDILSNCDFKNILMSEIRVEKLKYFRTIKILTKKLGILQITLSRSPHRKNHRNDFHVNIENVDNIYNESNEVCVDGCVIDINYLHEIDDINYIGKTSCPKKYNVDNILTLKQSRKLFGTIDKPKMKKMEIE